MPKSSDRAEMVLRLPRNLKNWIEREAEREERSQNATIVRLIRDRAEREQQQKAAG